MMNFISKKIFLLMVISGSLIAASSSSWLGVWMGLEINLLSFIPLMIDNKNLLSSESAIKYFLTQVFASMIFLFGSILFMNKYNYMYTMMNYEPESMIIISSMMLKLGSAPFHFWFPNVIEGLTWENSFILMTWQKLAPISMISYSNNSKWLIIFIVMSAFIGGIGGLNQISLRKILAFSSINHIGWMLLAMNFNNLLWIMYYIFYIIITLSIIMIFKMMNLFNTNQIFMFKNNFPLIKFCLFMNFMSLGGLPPFIGFIPKWMIIESMICNNTFLILFLMMTSLITLFFYIRLTLSSFMIFYPSFMWNLDQMKNKLLINMNMLFNMIMSLSLMILSIKIYYLL